MIKIIDYINNVRKIQALVLKALTIRLKMSNGN